jgi:hypothetical protein
MIKEARAIMSHGLLCYIKRRQNNANKKNKMMLLEIAFQKHHLLIFGFLEDSVQ